MLKRTGIILLLVLAAPAAMAGPAFAEGQPCPPECVTDTMEIVTWYPSPYNEYEELRLYPTQRGDADCDDNKIGLMYYDDGGTFSFGDNDKIMVCKGALLGWQELSGYWQLSGNDNIYNTNSGNVGIGTMTPGAKLSVIGTAGLAILNTESENGYRVAIRPDQSGVGNIYAAKNGVIGTELSFSTQQSSTGTVTERMRLNANGNVGIGTATPKTKLDVNGGVRMWDEGASCNNAREGTQRYNSASKTMEFCNGAAWNAVGGITYTYYCFSNSSFGTPVCSDAGGSRGYCPSGWTQKLALGSWGTCYYRVESGTFFLLPPGGSCGAGHPGSYVVGSAYVCLQDS